MDTVVPAALVAEDTELGRWAIAHALQSAGFDTYTAASPLEALGWVDRLPQLQAVIVAVRLGQDDVAAVSRYVRQRLPEAVLVVLAEQDDLREVSAACGSYAVVVPKPLDVAHILRIVTPLTGSRSDAMSA